jgi:hypothetical protein
MSRDFSVIALLAAYNEADVIDQVVRHLISQGVRIHLLDHGSTDGTLEKVTPFAKQGALTIEQFMPEEDSGLFTWERILARKEALALSLDADWFIHHDADECRDSPWPRTTLRDAIQTVDRLGYNAIDFEVFNFWPVDDSFEPGDDLDKSFRYYSPPGPQDRRQIKCWKKQEGQVDLRTLGGHEALFENRRVFPLRFILRHYPIRSQRHAERKVFRERRDRFLTAERERGWHLQYDDFKEGTSFIRDPTSLTRFDADRARLQVTVDHREVQALRTEHQQLAWELDRKRAEFGSLSGRYDQLARAHDALEQQLSVVAAALSRAELATRERIAAEAVLQAQVHGLQAQLRGLQAQVHALQTTAAARDRELANSVDELRLAENRISSLLTSRSWRWMAPLRQVYEVMQAWRQTAGR